MKYFVGIIITFSLGLNIVMSVMLQDLDLQVHTLSMVSAQHTKQIRLTGVSLATYDERVASLHTDVALLTSHCELAMDLGISTARGGWWGERVAEELRMLSTIQTLREESEYHGKDHGRTVP